MTVLVNDHDQVLLLWRHRFVQGRWGWELPAEDWPESVVGIPGGS
jgi:hypothetical protein